MRIAGRELTLSRPEKVFYPDIGFTKGDVVQHYRDVADVMLPHLAGRPLTLRRFPDGISDGGFFQKEVPDYFPSWISRIDIPLRGDGVSSQVQCRDAADLVYLADQATVEFHIWPSTTRALDRPDRLVIDIDPPDRIAAEELHSVARRVRDLFAELGLTPYVQATGGRGFHVVAPLDGSAGFEEARALATDAADLLAERDPQRLTTAFRKQGRGGRIFLDVHRNGYGQTFIAPYSLRSRPGAPCAVPLDWDELGRAEPNGWDSTRLRRRLAAKSDPWAEMDRHAAAVAAARDRLAKLGRR